MAGSDAVKLRLVLRPHLCNVTTVNIPHRHKLNKFYYNYYIYYYIVN